VYQRFSARQAAYTDNLPLLQQVRINSIVYSPPAKTTCASETSRDLFHRVTWLLGAASLVLGESGTVKVPVVPS
jgi:hypothetical protein